MTRHSGFLAALLILALGGCASPATRDALSIPSTGSAMDEQDLIILAVENDSAGTAPRPASTRPGLFRHGVPRQ